MEDETSCINDCGWIGPSWKLIEYYEDGDEELYLKCPDCGARQE